MSIICDYHMHTYLCKHAEGLPEEYLKTAYNRGLKTIGFSDHCPVPIGFDEESRMNFPDFSKYQHFIHEIQNNKYGVEVLFGLEVDWVPGRMDEVYDFLKTFKYDYLIGSVHSLEDYPIDHSGYTHLWNGTEESIDNVWNTYIDLLYDMVDSGRFDIIGHIDLPKKYGYILKHKQYFMSKLELVFKKASGNGIAMELNTAGLRKPIKEIYPSYEILCLAKKYNVSITFGSDSHSSSQPGKDFDLAEQLAVKAGFDEYLSIHKNNVKEIVKF